ncbi:sulfatase-like hydrolase/transferase [Panacibacter ginsenosidivorans]|uniref:Sulfatase-like hydrolase/transferase n=1 Tax=Panacibacter ginsenosidivorans TaxID=1813871 RepID=A0A5B8V5E7_9BACT|nr:sulfatase-like hydrolase/transferase [Panacibacter ginsenosidivorans]QEC66432.1 sulfatase-like hydrolase/transferase [Panacibacter ginsenosidivorans]
MLQKATFLNRTARFILLPLLFCIISFNCKKADSLKPLPKATVSSEISKLAAGDKPNIIFILGDDIGYELPTIDGGQSYATPNIDKMAQIGMRFTRFHASPLCSPSRVMLLTGKYNFRNYTVWGVLDTTSKTIANMLKDAGYKTSVVGKWQLDGGDASISAAGFQDYMIWSPFTSKNGERVKGKGSRYKDPVIYQNAGFLPKTLTQGKFGDDLFTNHIKDFIDANKSNPFFIYDAICLSHEPFEPPPNNPDFATWDPKTSTPDTKYFPSMVNYMDTKIGEILDKVTEAGIADKTLVIFVGDNGTDESIVSQFQDAAFRGGKSETNEAGTHVPMLMWWQGKIMPGTQNDFILDFTDLMPTFADIAGIPLPTNYGPLDGKSFYAALTGSSVPTRQWIYCYYDANMQGQPDKPPIGWVQDTAYKLYDSTGLFYHYSIDLQEASPLKNSRLTPAEKSLKKQMQGILAGMHN